MTPRIPLLTELHQGSWKGWISYEKIGEDPGVWSGQYDLQNAVIEIPGLASPVRIGVGNRTDERRWISTHSHAGAGRQCEV